MSRRSRLQAKQNAQHSTGPITEAGKAVSSQNSLRHGLSATVITALPGEDIQDFLHLANALRAEHKPVTVTEDALVTKLAQSIWLSQRAIRLQEQLFLASPTPDAKLLALYMRYQSTHDRTFSRSLKELQTLRKLARAQEAGFVSQKPPQRSAESPARPQSPLTAPAQSAPVIMKVPPNA